MHQQNVVFDKYQCCTRPVCLVFERTSAPKTIGALVLSKRNIIHVHVGLVKHWYLSKTTFCWCINDALRHFLPDKGHPMSKLKISTESFFKGHQEMIRGHGGKRLLCLCEVSGLLYVILIQRQWALTRLDFGVKFYKTAGLVAQNFSKTKIYSTRPET